ncbi:Spy/CpxP family protein refolding chaperone [Bartonella sp. HY406]|uniref:Spy/CpxP family protein refolding chaperone n=1 Tax=Bartonella sp. HY406 TaxID=2979331 RepID=UPI0021CA53ED|nr:Spy/CpxP family protein refolding chaperone [Bartonella sp. HY406]UXN02852.1 Spy/CpxP family protein refolding chaperone [Bartonella sp. HY406]
MKKVLFSTMMVGALALPGLAFAAPDAPKPTAPHAEQAPVGNGPRGHAGEERHALRMAERLSAIETAIGIKSDQLDSWRAYTAALVGLMPEPPHADKAPRDGETADGPKELILGERMADRMIEQAEKAKAFKKAAEELREKLTPEQLARLNNLAREMRAEHVGDKKPSHVKPDGEHKAHAKPDHGKPSHPEGQHKPRP